MREAIKLGKAEKVRNGVRWTKMIKGNVWDSTVFPEDSRRNRSDAWQQFLEWRDDLEAKQQATINDKRTVSDLALLKGVDQIKVHAEFLDMVKEPKLARGTREIAEGFNNLIGKGNNPEVAKALIEFLNQPQFNNWHVEATHVERAKKATKGAQPAKLLVDDFITFHAARARGGEITNARVGVIRNGCRNWLLYWGDNRDMRDIEETDVTAYYQSLLKRIEKGENPNTLNDHWAIFKMFVDHVASNNKAIVRPANLRNKTLKITKTRTEPNPFTPEEFKLVFEHSTDQTKLYLALMINVGMYQGDIAELLASEVDWTNGRIIRTRSKKKKQTKGQKTAPIKVNYLLWKKTFELLKANGYREGLAVRNEDGNPLLTTSLDDENVESKNDNVRSAYNRVIVKLKNRKLLPKTFNKTLKQLRKTGASLIADSEHAVYCDLFLDHGSVAAKHYKRSGKVNQYFDAAITWLGDQLGL